MDSIHYAFSEGVGFITLNRPKKYNSFNRDMALALQKHLDHCAEQDEVRAVYITGAGKAFCAGQDLGEAADPDGPAISTIVEEHYNPIILQIRNLEKPVVAAVNGVAAGAGANIALACDITVATETATFIQAFSKIGLIPDSGGTFFLPRILGMQRASALAMLGDKVSAKEAEDMGMIYKMFADDEFEEKSKEIAIKLADMPTKGLAMTKKLFNMSWLNPLDEQLNQEGILQTKAAATDDYQEGVDAFLERRKPKFKGK